MAKNKYLTAPIPSKKTPAGVPYILTNEAAERFAFYGMTSILVIYMTTHLMGRDGTLNVMGEERAKTWFHFFNAAALGHLVRQIQNHTAFFGSLLHRVFSYNDR
jgi:POT family proton-dependent oligopeptide transporter